ncbi:potassium channel family protein [Halorarum salinum]|uniref:NAD-binding protein n=1 Tax=Halorarum salinum TaxID=2743089 RepID=A0A7D5LA73_9EURY|nr:potassium channel protein [Halobaculum salinum]QLG61627.1 NAD-binding protein [Halobaculum salinum]
MNTWRRRTAVYLAAIAAIILAYAIAYHEAMRVFEGEQQTFLHSLQIVVETFTTTGFGSDSPWESDAMNLLVIVMDVTGVLLIFTALPVFVFPLFEEMLSTTPPTAVEDLSGHVVVCAHTSRGRVLRNELVAFDVPYVFVVGDEDEAIDLHEGGEPVVHGDPEDVDTLRAANAERATALVADADDETNASVVLSAREVSETLRVVSLVEDEDVADYHRYAGADEVVSPRRALGQSLGAKATQTVSDELGEAVELGEHFEVAELLVHRDSPLAGRTVADAGVGERTGANIIGAWVSGEFESPPDPDRVLDEHTVVLAAGSEEQLEALKRLTLSETRRHRRGPVIVAGYGVVGRAAATELAATEEVVVVDREDKHGVDVVGDVTDRATLEEAGIDEARSVLIALGSDTTTVFTALAVKQVAPEVEIIARANDPESVPKLYRAGAGYVLALSTVSGRMLASYLLEEDVLRPESQIELVRMSAPHLRGRSLGGADVRARTGCTVVAIERDGAVIGDVGPDTVVRKGDTLVVAGTDESVARFSERLA